MECGKWITVSICSYFNLTKTQVFLLIKTAAIENAFDKQTSRSTKSAPPQVEKDRKCQEWLKRAFPSTCIFEDIFQMIQNRVPKKSVLKASTIQFKDKAYCVNHKKECSFRFHGDALCILGTPCILFSRYRGDHRGLSKSEVYSSNRNFNGELYSKWICMYILEKLYLETNIHIGILRQTFIV